jgi:uncharacterized protein DUF6940
MAAWSTTSEDVLSARGRRYEVFDGHGRVTYDAAIDLLRHSDDFRCFLSDVVTKVGYEALRWETPPITLHSIHRPFEFVLMNDPFLAAAPEPHVFSSYFDTQPPAVDVLAVSNLGKTAKLVVPRGIARPEVYVHLKAFLGSAPVSQVQSLWRCVADTARKEVSDRPLWISTAGAGVSWLHVRLEHTPKYYAYRPYATA